MMPNAFVLCAAAAIFGCFGFGLHASAFVVSNAPSASQSSAQQAAAAAAAKQQMSSIAAELMAYPAALAATRVRGGGGGGTGGGGGRGAYMTTGGGGSSPVQDSGEAGERAAVYDPGDELLRALNSEMASSGSALGTLPQEPDYADTVFTGMEVASQFDMLRQLEQDLREEQDIVSKSAILMRFLEDPTLETLPLVYVEEAEAPLGADDDGDVDGAEEVGGGGVNLLYPAAGSLAKRSRYYRRYPWKRHNRNRSHYEPELRYACTPSKEDVFKLLVGLHENRKGNHHKTVQFCNRKRPAKAIFTNIRFLG